jgi:hypothetical protein
MSSSSMKVATETASRVHHLRSMESRSPCHLGWAWLSQTSYQKDDRRPARYDNLTRTSREGVDAMLDRLGAGRPNTQQRPQHDRRRDIGRRMTGSTPG